MNEFSTYWNRNTLYPIAGELKPKENAQLKSSCLHLILELTLSTYCKLQGSGNHKKYPMVAFDTWTQITPLIVSYKEWESKEILPAHRFISAFNTWTHTLHSSWDTRAGTWEKFEVCCVIWSHHPLIWFSSKF